MSAAAEAADARTAIETIYRNDRRRVLATLLRLLGGFDAAEEALDETFFTATERWPREGIPNNPISWLISVGRFKSIDRKRRQARLAAAVVDLTVLGADTREPERVESIEDDELRLIFVCCHPALPEDARIALTLREVGGLTTEEIARAYLTRPATVAQRIVRAKGKIRDEALPYEIPVGPDLLGRVESVLKVIYLVFNEGYAATSGASLLRSELCATAIRLGRLVAALVDDAEALGLLALMLLHEARRHTRVDADGDMILLEHQDRSRWHRAQIGEAVALVERAFASGPVGAYTLQAAIAAVHANATTLEATDWGRIVSLYDRLLRTEPSPVVELNRAAAVAMRDGPEQGLAAIEAAIGGGALDGYPHAHAARADMLRRVGRVDDARAAYRRALGLTQLPAERRFLEARLEQLAASDARR